MRGFVQVSAILILIGVIHGAHILHQKAATETGYEIQFTFFNIMNSEAYVTNEELARFKEAGPYTYKEVREKRDSVTENDYLEYSQYIHYEFVPEKSCEACTEDDMITILNMPLIGAVDAAMKEGFLAGIALAILAGKIENTETSKDIVITDTVNNILFGGVNNDLIHELITNGLLKNRLPPAIRDNGFALFNGRNASSHNENYRVFTQPPERENEIAMWGQERDALVSDLSTTRTCPSTIGGVTPSCSKSENPVWWPNPDGEGQIETSVCNYIKGTTGENFPPSVGDRVDDDLWTFTIHLCKSLVFRFASEEKYGDTDVLRFEIPTGSMNVNKKKNICLCKDFAERGNKGCLKYSSVEDEYDISDCELTTCYDGLINVENCQKSPVRMSAPHFFMAEEQLQYFDSSFVKPDADKDKSFLDIEPVSGQVLQGHKRFQVNMPVTPTGRNEIKFLKNIKAVPAFPVMWFDEIITPV